MTTTTATLSEQKICAQSIGSMAAAGILVHFIHELIVLWGDVPVVQPAVGVVAVAATVALVGLWYRTSKTTRRAFAAILGALWALFASEHLGNVLSGSSTALDITGLLTFAGGLALLFAAFFDYYRPLEVQP